MNLLRNRLFSSILLVLTVTLLLFIGYYFFVRRNVGLSYYIDKLNASPRDPVLGSPTYRMMREEYSVLNKKYTRGKSIVFVGDSITRRFMLDEYFPNEGLLNRGIFSDTTMGCLQRLDANINILQPVTTFILIGHNDLPYRENREIVGNIKKIVTALKGGRKYLQSILPVYGDQPEINGRILALNERLEAFCAETNRCIYIDLYSYFVDGHGVLDVKYSLDGVHLNAAGYSLWASLISSRIDNELEDAGK